MQAVIKFLRANPQALALLIICVVLGIGTFIAVIVALLSTPGGQTTGEPSGVHHRGVHVARGGQRVLTRLLPARLDAVLAGAG